MSAETTSATLELELWVCWDEEGQYVVGVDPDQLGEQADEECLSKLGRRTVKLMLSVPAPAVVELAGQVSMTGGPITLTAQ